MKSIFNLLILLVVSTSTFSQSAITINAADMPIPSTGFNYDEITTQNPPNPIIGANQNWNYGSFFSNNILYADYVAETDPFYSNAGVDVYFLGFKTLSPALALGYSVYSELDFNQNGVDDKGAYIADQTFSLQGLTGNSADNITFPLQGYIVNSPRRVIQFPMTANSAWESTGKWANDFTLTATAFGLNNTPGKHVYDLHRKDTVVGWGTLRVYASGGPSIPYEVLVSQSEQYSVDSFYLGGAPAPGVLLNAFSLTQGQQSDVFHNYNFYRAGSYSFLMRLAYGSDPTYTNLENAFVNTDNLTSSTNNDASAEAYSTILFPNPSNGETVNLMVIGKEVNQVSYALLDKTGRVVQSTINQSIEGNMLSVRVASELSSGMYILQVTDASNTLIATEQISIQR